MGCACNRREAQETGVNAVTAEGDHPLWQGQRPEERGDGLTAGGGQAPKKNKGAKRPPKTSAGGYISPRCAKDVAVLPATMM